MCAKHCKVHINIGNTTYFSFSPPFLIENGIFDFFPTGQNPSFSLLAFWAISRAKKKNSFSLSLPQWYSNLVMLVLFLTLSIIVNPVAPVTASESHKESSYGDSCTFYYSFIYKKIQKAPYISTNTLICKYLCVPINVKYI